MNRGQISAALTRLSRMCLIARDTQYSATISDEAKTAIVDELMEALEVIEHGGVLVFDGTTFRLGDGVDEEETGDDSE